MIWDIPTILNLISQGALVIPKFVQLWNGVKDTFNSTDAAKVDAALRAAITQDALDTAQALLDLDAAAKRT